MSHKHTKKHHIVSMFGKSISQRDKGNSDNGSLGDKKMLAKQASINAAVDTFINARQRHCLYSLTPISKMRNLNSGKPNMAFHNAHTVTQHSKLTNNKVACMSGWVIQRHFREREFFTIIQHWWNVDNTGQHFDTTPIGDGLRTYVLDFNIYEYGRLNFSYITSNVARSLLLENSKFSMLYDEERMFFIELSELRTEFLFR